jgi:adenylosuccinate synthase
MLNGVDSLIMMKADVLNPFTSIKICTHYSLDGETLNNFPFDLCDEKLGLVYREMKGWDVPLSECTNVTDLPAALAEYVMFIENQVGLPIDIVSIGPDRVQTLQR